MKGWIYAGALVVGIAGAFVALTNPAHFIEGTCGLGAAVVVFLLATLT